MSKKKPAKSPTTPVVVWPHQHKEASAKQVAKAVRVMFDEQANIVVHVLRTGGVAGLTKAQLSAAVILDLICPLSASVKVGIRPTGRHVLSRRMAADAAALAKLHAL